MDSDLPRRRGTPSAQAARLFGVSLSMKKERIMLLAMTIAVLVVSSQAMTACQQAEDTAAQHATTQEGRTTDRGATNASVVADPRVVTTLRAWGNNYSGQLGDETYGNNRTRPVKVVGLRGAKVEDIAAGQGHTLALKAMAASWRGATTGTASWATAPTKTAPRRCGPRTSTIPAAA
jgi:Regulator of chromosome condensation (RCC1) repeat